MRADQTKTTTAVSIKETKIDASDDYQQLVVASESGMWCLNVCIH